MVHKNVIWKILSKDFGNELSLADEDEIKEFLIHEEVKQTEKNKGRLLSNPVFKEAIKKVAIEASLKAI